MKLSPGLSDVLNLSRWVAALLVVLGHLRSLLFIDFVDVVNPSLIVKVFYFITSFGHEAVLVFFVMSGFLVGGSTISKMKNGSFSYSQYFIARISRIFPVYLVALIFTLCCDLLGYAVLDAPTLYDGSQKDLIPSITSSYSEQWNLVALFGNLIMLQPFFVPTYGSNGPLWSLSYEWWYYASGPLLFSMFLIKLSPAALLLRIAVLLSLFAVFPLHLFEGFALWVLGAVVSQIRKGHWIFRIIGPSLLLISLALYKAKIFPHTKMVYLIPIIYLIILVGFIESERHIFLKSFHRYFADFSYSLYLIHFPLMIFLVSICSIWGGQYSGREKLSGDILLLSVCLLLISIVISWLISRVTEVKTPYFRKLLSDWCLRS
jgi:peptidoglycan/LPS O-acetylase OafA/YrhL